MMTTQKQVLNRLEEIADERDLALIVDFEASNTGIARFVHGFTTHLTLRFDFQSTYSTFIFHPDDLRTRRNISVSHSKSVDWDMFFGYVLAGLPKPTIRKEVS